MSVNGTSRCRKPSSCFAENVGKVHLLESWAISTRRANAHLGSSSLNLDELWHVVIFGGSL